MRIRILALTIPLAIAACASPAASPSAAPVSVAPSSAAPSISAAPSPSAASAAPSVAPSEAPADPFSVFRDDTLTPVVDEITTAATQWATAVSTAAGPDATDLDQIALSNAAFRFRTALASASALLAEEVPDMPECGVEVQQQAQAFVETLTQDSEDLLAADDPTADQLADATALAEKTATDAVALAETVAQACA